MVEASGSLDEDGRDAKIACTQIKLVKELSVYVLVGHAMVYMIKHPLRPWEKRGHMLAVARGKAKAEMLGAVAIARGKCPKVKGKNGAILGLIKETGEGIISAKLFMAGKEARRKDQIRALMDEVSLFLDDICQWMLDAIGPQDYLFYHKEEKRWFCSLCGRESTDKELVDAVEQGEEGKKEEARKESQGPETQEDMRRLQRG